MKRLRKTLECVCFNLADDFQDVLIDLDNKAYEEEQAYAAQWFKGQGSNMVNRIRSASEYKKWWKQQLAYGYSEEWDAFMNEFDEDIAKTEKKRKKKRTRGSKKKKKGIQSQKFIGDKEVSDKEFWRYNNEVDGYLEDDDNPLDSYYEPKEIFVYRTLDDMLDFDKFESILAFDEWCDTWDYNVPIETINNCLWYNEVHCFVVNNKVISARSYGDLVYEVTGGDYELIAKYSNIN